MTSSNAIRAGHAFVEIGVDNRPLRPGLEQAQATVRAYAKSISQIQRQSVEAYASGSSTRAASLERISAGLRERQSTLAQAASGRAALQQRLAVYKAIRAEAEAIARADMESAMGGYGGAGAYGGEGGGRRSGGLKYALGRRGPLRYLAGEAGFAIGPEVGVLTSSIAYLGVLGGVIAAALAGAGAAIAHHVESVNRWKQMQIDIAEQAERYKRILEDLPATTKAGEKYRQVAQQAREDEKKWRKEAGDGEEGWFNRNWRALRTPDSHLKLQAQWQAMQASSVASEYEAKAKDEETAQAAQDAAEAAARQEKEREDNRRQKLEADRQAGMQEIAGRYSIEDARLAAMEDGSAKQLAALKSRHAREIEEGLLMGRHMTVIYNRQAAEVEAAAAQQARSLDSVMAGVARKLAIAQAGQLSPAAGAKVSLAFEWADLEKSLIAAGALKEQIAQVRIQWDKLQQANARKSVSDQIEEMNLQLAVSVGNLKAIDAEMARIAKANPLVDPAALDNLRKTKEALSSAQFAQGEKETLKTPSEKLQEYIDKVKDAVGRGYLSQAQADALTRSKQAEMFQVKTSVVGTFNASAAYGLGQGNVAERTAKASEETAKNTKKLLDKDAGTLRFAG